MVQSSVRIPAELWKTRAFVDGLPRENPHLFSTLFVCPRLSPPLRADASKHTTRNSSVQGFNQFGPSSSSGKMPKVQITSMKYHVYIYITYDYIRMELQNIRTNHHIHSYPKVKPYQEWCAQFQFAFDILLISPFFHL